MVLYDLLRVPDNMNWLNSANLTSWGKVNIS